MGQDAYMETLRTDAVGGGKGALGHFLGLLTEKETWIYK